MVYLILTKNRKGESRKFAYIGFQSAADAAEAQAYFNNNFVDTSKISVDFALPVSPLYASLLPPSFLFLLPYSKLGYSHALFFSWTGDRGLCLTSFFPLHLPLLLLVLVWGALPTPG